MNKKIEKINKLNTMINIATDDYNLNDFLFCYEQFGERPNKIVIHNTYITKSFEEILFDGILSKNQITEVIPDSNGFIVNDKMFICLDLKCYLSYVVVDRQNENSFIDTITFYYKGDYDGVQAILDKLNNCLLDYCEDDSHKVNTVVLTPNGLELEPVNLPEANPDIDTFYNSDTFKQVEKVIKKVKKSDKGLVILYGDRGTGKTSILSHLTSKLDRLSIFIPNSMIDHTINNPDFRRFIKKYERPIIILDDCENIFSEVFSKSNIISNNLLQMVDGFLADSINTTIITIFNEEDSDDIDHSLVDCNNLIDLVEFKTLTIDECNGLSKHLDFNKKYKSEARVVDVVKKRDSKLENTIGF
jgi:hypothetical protein